MQPEPRSSLIEDYAVELQLGIGFFPYAVHIGIASLAVWTIWTNALASFLIGWLVVLASGILFQIAFLMRQSKAPPSTRRTTKTLSFSIGMGIFIGIAWAVLLIVAFPNDSYVGALFLVFSAGGLAMGAVATQHLFFWHTVLSIGIALPILALRFGFSDYENPIVHSVSLFIYTLVLIDLTARLRRLSLKASLLQIEQAELLDELSEQTIALETAKREAEIARRDAEAANEAKSRFLAQASHDLRQPLHATNLFIGALDETATKAERKDIVQRVRQSLDILTKLFDSLLDVTLLDTGGIEVNEKAFSVDTLLCEVLQDFSLVTKACNVELRTVPTSAVVKTDPVLLRRMLQNLVSNAVRHSEGGCVLVGCRRIEKRLAIQVYDTGKGISDVDQARIFDEFERLEIDRMGKEASPGLGLGLAIVKRIAAELNLDIRLSSKLGQGSVFTIDGLDLVETVDISHEAAQSTYSETSNSLRVFLLDDDPLTRQATSLLLTRWGYDLETTDEIESLYTTKADIIICDFEIGPNLNGIDVVDHFRGEKSGTVPVIMISGNTSPELQAAAKQRSISLLHKPLRPVQLRSAILNASTVHNMPRAVAKEAAAARLERPSVRNIAET